MCGIFCWIIVNEEDNKGYDETKRSILRLVRRRGPDGFESSVHKINCKSSCLPHKLASSCEESNKQEKATCDTGDEFFVRLEMAASVLHLRGKFTSQPLKDDMGNALLWNGEIFGGVEVVHCWHLRHSEYSYT